MARKFNIDYHTVQLLLQEPFWGHISRRISKVETEKIPTAGVTVKDGDMRMYYNPNFCQKLVDEEGEKKIVGLLKHELCHLFYEHVTSRKRDPAIIHNYATDLAIDSQLAELTTERIALLYIRNAVMRNIAKFKDELDDHNIKRVFHTIINNPDLNLNQLSLTLNLREESIKSILKELEKQFPSL